MCGRGFKPTRCTVSKRAYRPARSFNDIVASGYVHDLPVKPLPQKVLRQSLRQLGAWAPQYAEEQEANGTLIPSFIRRCIELADIPLKDFQPCDLRVMLGQQIAPEYLVPLALTFLEICPELESEFHKYDLLAFTVDQKSAFWRKNPDLTEKMEAILDGIIDRRRKEYMALKRWKAPIIRAKVAAAKQQSKVGVS